MWPALLVCFALAGLTLFLPSTPTYDPWAWIMWGREIAHLDLVTTGGPSWKPLPVVFTTFFSFLGSDLAPYLWLWVARAGGMFALVMAFRLTRRLTGGGVAGAIAGVTACAFLLTSYQFARDAALGNSEPLLAALALGLRAPPRRPPRPRALPRVRPSRCCDPRRGRSSASTACGCGFASPSCACGWPRSAC